METNEKTDREHEPGPGAGPTTAKAGLVRPLGWHGSDAVGFGASLVLHGLFLLALAWVTIPTSAISRTFDLLGEAPIVESLDGALNLEETTLDLDSQEFDNPLQDAASDAAPPTLSPVAIAAAPVTALDLSASLTRSSLLSSLDASAAVVSGVGLDGRTAAGRSALVQSKGGSRASEAAVARGLKWLEEHQNRDGSWSLIHTAGACRGRCGNPSTVGGDDPFGESIASATGLALLPFLGAGETHKSGRRRDVVRAGLRALVRLGHPEKDRPGLSWRDSGRMYAHGICTIVLCEAYSLTGDPELRRPAQAALEYLFHAQDPAGGGWRYTPQRPGDTSVTGWQVMAMKSGQLAGLPTPRRVSRRAARFLDSASSNDGAAYGYLANPGGDGYRTTPTLTAVGLLCRQYMGWPQDDPRLTESVKALAERGPIEGHYYHNYYAAQTIFHQTGGEGATWRLWNEAARDQLIATQATRGHERGSWWAPDHHNERGGRLYATALATMTLEVYYRYLPIYQSEAVRTDLSQ